MENFAVFLRGVNVGGVTIKSADLKACLAALPVSGVKKLLASGNVVLQASLTAGELKYAVETALRERFGYEAWVVVLTGSRIGELIPACPYPADSAELHTYLTLFTDHAAAERLSSELAELENIEWKSLGPEATAWTVEVGSTLDSPISKLTAKAVYKASTTTRNLRTMIKVRDALAG
ncbi:conserved hypothetical protein [Renibacterium salmoninarum ATCC 33209]|uniref:Pyridoxamine 5-phosphate oxidase n=1 Tax=Renibacterium salmoninarum (strain ATCC 33209 / DSM 20767 / JCM 11484 / NBRC 15589 / NCIMB 2235) TaxID=288705 RepID=A9WMH4_RENSM|nr:DUF1697 domain-containing protein [Renibacterium salmoninarum]ABY23529.1 conserved hypothetical protein [Renibacterium salmoninarum ATCC 33209]